MLFNINQSVPKRNILKPQLLYYLALNHLCLATSGNLALSTGHTIFHLIILCVYQTISYLLNVFHCYRDFFKVISGWIIFGDCLANSAYPHAQKWSKINKTNCWNYEIWNCYYDITDDVADDDVDNDVAVDNDIVIKIQCTIYRIPRLCVFLESICIRVCTITFGKRLRTLNSLCCLTSSVIRETYDFDTSIQRSHLQYHHTYFKFSDLPVTLLLDVVITVSHVCSVVF